jgi:hypothetical protein
LTKRKINSGRVASTFILKTETEYANSASIQNNLPKTLSPELKSTKKEGKYNLQTRKFPLIVKVLEKR